jgi:hypothetical protein
VIATKSHCGLPLKVVFIFSGHCSIRTIICLV